MGMLLQRHYEKPKSAEADKAEVKSTAKKPVAKAKK